MIQTIKFALIAAICLVLSSPAAAGELSGIKNYLQYSETFASAGQPDLDQLKLLEAEGFERVIYIAFAGSKGAIADEDLVVKELGMDYVQVPVIWDAPEKSDFYAFAGAMQSAPGKKTLLHCQANYRATAFAFLYRVLHEAVPMAKAKADMNTIWHPDGAWKELIFDVLKEQGQSPDCEGCDWSVKD